MISHDRGCCGPGYICRVWLREVQEASRVHVEGQGGTNKEVADELYSAIATLCWRIAPALVLASEGMVHLIAISFCTSLRKEQMDSDACFVTLCSRFGAGGDIIIST